MGELLRAYALNAGYCVNCWWACSRSDPFTLTFAALLLFFVALVATWLPARRASRVDPVMALRAE